MSDIIKFLDTMNMREGVLFMAFVVVIVVFAIQKWDWIIGRFGITSKKILAEKERDSDILELKTHAKKSDDNFNKVFASIETLQNSVNDLSNKVEEMQKKNDDAERSRLKDRIAQSYKVYKSHGYWSSIEREAFNDLVKSYEMAGGENSFVHSICIPATLQLDIVDDDD